MNIKEKIKAIAAEALENMVDKEILEWPPGCLGILCQPERPLNDEIK